MIDINKIISISETIEVEETSDGTSAYGVWKIARDIFAELKIEFSATSQMFYNYAKTGKINGVKDSKQRFSDDEIENFVALLIAKASK